MAAIGQHAWPQVSRSPAGQPAPGGMKRLRAAGSWRCDALALLLPLVALPSAAACPCSDPDLCRPIQGARDFEVFVFDVGGGTWRFYNWTHITTVATFGDYDPELMCYAHAKGARVVLKGVVPLKDMLEPAARGLWITQQVELAKKQYMDGINMDIAEAVNKSSPEYDVLTALMKETAEAFHSAIPGSQVTFDVAWSPECIDQRCYNYSGITDACDFVFVMSYDEDSPVWPCRAARANAPYNQTLTGFEDYINMGIDPKKLVMGVPWYGYDYTCLNLSKVSYKAMMKQVNSSISGRLWDKEQKAPYYEYKDALGHFHQVWYDDPQSISLKAAYVQKRGLRGIGMWNANCLDYSRTPVAEQQTEAMWQALIP